MAEAKTKRNQKKELLAREQADNKTATSANPITGESDGEEDELTLGERYVMQARPYWSLIALGILSAVLLFVFWNYFQNMRQEASAEQWRSLSTAITQAELSGDIGSLKEMANEYEGQKAGNWANQFAGDFELRRGLGMMNYDRAGGMNMIETAETTFRKVVDAPVSSKTTMLQRRSLFSLAYASESLGKFDIAQGLYKQLIDDAGESPFLDVATRGLARCENPKYAEVFSAFKDWEDVAEDAPGPIMQDRPNLDTESIPDFGSFEGGADFGTEMKSSLGSDFTDKAAPEGDAVDTKATETKKPDPAAAPTVDGDTEVKVDDVKVEATEPAAGKTVEGLDTEVIEGGTEVIEGGTEVIEGGTEVIEGAEGVVNEVLEGAGTEGGN